MSDVTDLDLALSKHCRRSSDPAGEPARLLEQYNAALRTEILAADGQAYDGELTMLRGLVATLAAVAQHGDLVDVQKLLREYVSDDAEARDGIDSPAADPASAPSERAQFITGMRDFADWLEQNPDVRDPGSQRFLLSLTTNPAVEEFAARHGLTVTVDNDGNAFTDISFGPVTYHAYGYADFDQFVADQAEQDARQWADKNGMTIQPAEVGESS